MGKSMRKFLKKNKGVTIVALVVTIIVLIILAGISIGTLFGDNGVVTVSKNQKREQEVNIITQTLKTSKIDLALKSDNGEVLVDKYIEEIKNSEKVQNKVTKVEKVDEDIAYITLDDSYVYLLEEKQDGDLEITYEGEVTNVAPRIRNVEVTSANEKIEVKVTALRTETYKFYIKEKGASKYTEVVENTTGEYVFRGLTKDRKYYIKIEAINGKGQDQEELSVITADMPNLTTAEVTFKKSNTNWINENVVTEVEINTRKDLTGCELQYAKFNAGSQPTEEELELAKWTKYTDEKITSEINEIIYIRLAKGYNSTSYISTEITNIDKIQSIITTQLSSSDVTTKGFKLNVEIIDELSGLGKIVWNYKLKGAESYSNVENVYTELNGKVAGVTTKVNKIREITDLKTGTYSVYALVYDVAGNYTTSETIEVTLRPIEKAEGATSNPTEWINGDVTVTLPIKAEYITQYQIGTLDKDAEWKEYNTEFEVSSNTTVYYRYSDGINAGEHNYIEISNIDREAPEVSSVEIKNVTPTGYDVYVNGVKDNGSGVNRVVISTWTEANGQDDIKTVNGEDKGNGTWYYRVNVTDHSSEIGKYNTKVEIYDDIENKTTLDTKTVDVPGVVITFDKNDGTTDKTTITKGYNLEIGTLPIVTRTGYTFNGWYTDKTNGTEITETTKVPASNVTYYAQWTPITYTITYDLNGGNLVTENPTSYNVETENITLNNPTRIGYTFTGWTGSNGEIPQTTVTIARGSTGNKSYTANWQINTYTVTYDVNYYDDNLWTNTNQIDKYFSAGTVPKSKVNFSEEIATGGQGIKFVMPTGDKGGPYYVSPEALTVGEMYTWSVYIKSNNNITLRIGQEQGGVKNVNVTTEWQKLTYTFTANNNANKAFIFYGAWTEGDELYVHSLEIMKGTPTHTKVSKTYGATLGTLTTPIREGYTFKGWYTELTGGTKIESTTTIGASDVTYYARWTANNNTEYKVVHQQMSLDGTTYTTVDTESKTGTTDTSVTPSVKTYEGFTSPSTQTVMIKGDGSTTVIYKYTRNKYAFILGTGTGVVTTGSSESGEYYYGETIILKGTATTGYTWGKWISSNTSLVESTTTANTTFTMPAGAITMTPSATINSYNVTYNYSENGGSSANKTTATVNYNSDIDLTVTATKSGYTFVGWNTDKDATAGLTSLKMGISDVTLYAIYSKTVTATCNFYNGQSTKVSGTMYNKATSVSVTLPTISNQTVNNVTYTQRGWSTSDSANATVAVASGKPVTLSADATYYASYQATITGTFYYSTLGAEEYVYSNAGKATTTTATRYMGYKGVYVQSNFTVPTVVTGSTGGAAASKYVGVATSVNSEAVVTPTTANTTFYAVYTEDLTFYYYDGSAATSKTVTRRMLSNGTTYSTSLSEEEPKPSDYDGASFVAWTHDSTKHETTYRREALSTGANNLYAIYQKTITITYDANGGTGAPSAETGTKTYISKDGGFNTYNPNITLSSNKPTKTGYTFAGWYDAKTGGNKIGDAGATYVASANITIYARWTANTYTVAYNGNGATSGSTASSSHIYDTAKDLTANGFTRAYTVTFNHNYTGSTNTTKTATYTFKNWNTKADGSGTAYADKASVKNLATSGTFNLYAQWNSASVTYVPTRTGYTFEGWYAETECTTQKAGTNGIFTPTANITLYAKWTDDIAPTAPTTMSYVFTDWSPYTNDTWTNRDVYAARESTSPGPTGATDSGSGIAKYQISKDNSTWYDYNYNSQDSMYCMNTEGTHIRYFRAVDNAGNVSASISRVAKIDKTIPTVKVYVNNVEIVGTVDAEGTSWRGYFLGNYNQNKTVKVVVNDKGGAGVKQLEILNQLPNLQFANETIAGSEYTYTVTEEGEYCFHIKAIDNAGNTTKGISTEDEWIRKRIKIDKTAPTVTLTASTTEWTNQNVKVTATYSDNVGVTSKTLTCTGISGTDYIANGTTDITVINNGKTVTATAKDAAGNTTTEALSINNIDKLAPGVTTVTYNSGSNSHSWKNNYNLQLTAEDTAATASSGKSYVSYYELDWDGDGDANSTAGSNFIPWNGYDSCNNRFRAVDAAGNRGPWSETQDIHMDTEAPGVATVTYNSGSNTCSWKNNYNITLSSSDNIGIGYYEIDNDGNGTADRTIQNTFIPENGYSSCNTKFRAVDNAGNKGAWSDSHHIHMDTQIPTHTNWWWGEVTKDVARLYIQTTDNSGISKVQCPTSTQTGGYNNWHWFEAVWDAGANAYRCDITPSTFGHYNQTYKTHLYIYDYAGNGGFYSETSVAIPALATNFYAIQEGNLVNAPNASAWHGGHSAAHGTKDSEGLYFYGGYGHTNGAVEKWGANTGNINTNGCKYLKVNPYVFIWGSIYVPSASMQVYGDGALIANYEGSNLCTSTTENYNTHVKCKGKDIIIDISKYSTISVYINVTSSETNDAWVYAGFQNVYLYN